MPDEDRDIVKWFPLSEPPPGERGPPILWKVIQDLQDYFNGSSGTMTGRFRGDVPNKSNTPKQAKKCE